MKIFFVGGSRRVFVKEVLFQLGGLIHPQDDANKPNPYPDSKSPILALSNNVSFVSKFILKGSDFNLKKKSAFV